MVMYLYIKRYGVADIHVPALILFIVLALVSVIVFITSYSNIGSRYEGPLIFSLSAFLFLGVELCLLTVLAYILGGKYSLLALILIFIGFLTKYSLPYYVFDGYVNYDTPVHYLSTLYLRDLGLNINYHYHPWPSWLILNNVFREVSGLKFPVDASIVALASRFLIPLSIYTISRRYLMNGKAVLIAMLVLLIFEPFIIHPSPLITAVALTILAMVAFLNQLYRVNSGYLAIMTIVGIAVATYHAIMPVALIASILTVLIFYELTPKFVALKTGREGKHEELRAYLVVGILTTIVVFYNTYITVFVTRSLARTLTLLLQGDTPRLDVYPLIIENPEIAWQYNMLAIVSIVALLFLLGIPSAIVATYLLIKYLKLGLTNRERVVLATAIIAGANAAIHVFFGYIFKVGLVERFFQISYILSPVLTAYLYEKLPSRCFHNCRIMSTKKVVHMIMLVGTPIFMMLSMFTSPAYTTLYASAFGKTDLNTAQWVARYLPNSEVYLDGSGRLNQLIALYSYPSHVYKVNLSITRVIEVNALNEKYTYPNGVIITTRKPLITLTTATSTVKGLSDTMLSKHVESLPLHIDKLFSNSVCEIFIVK